ncbi:MAG TPA: PDZ domain-containing protein [Thermoanaerobaculia bacterium]|nr:PDZ domain-containing protein [Thermoanaerobaculia bacterium]
MRPSALQPMLLATLLLAPATPALRAQVPAPPAPPSAPKAAPEAPEAPDAPEAPRARRKIVVASPEKDIVVDGDRVFISGDDDEDAEVFADIDGFDGHPFAFRGHGFAGGGFIGLQPVEMTPDLRQHFGAPKDAGVFVGSVEAGGPAAKAGLQVGDIVTRVDGDRIGSTRALVRAIRHKKGGETVTVEILRNRAAKSLSVTVAERKDPEVRVGELRDKHRGRDWNWAWKGFTPPPDLPPDFEQRLDDMEKKLKELEGRLPSH